MEGPIIIQYKLNRRNQKRILSYYSNNNKLRWHLSDWYYGSCFDFVFFRLQMSNLPFSWTCTLTLVEFLLQDTTLLRYILQMKRHFLQLLDQTHVHFRQALVLFVFCFPYLRLQTWVVRCRTYSNITPLVLFILVQVEAQCYICSQVG